VKKFIAARDARARTAGSGSGDVSNPSTPKLEATATLDADSGAAPNSQAT